jgi:hypothetical protein
MAGGYVTPLSDQAAWDDVYRMTRAKFDNVDFTERVPDVAGGLTRKEVVANYRAEVGKTMEAVSFVSPWKRTVGGDYWIAFSTELDHTIRQPKSNDGARAERHGRDINGEPLLVSRPESDPSKLIINPMLGKVTDAEVKAAMYGETRPETPKYIEGFVGTRAERKEANRAKAAASRAVGAVAKYEYPGSTEQKNLAFKHGRVLQAIGAREGRDSKTKTLWYKLGIVVSLRSQGALPHAKFEADLLAAGYTEEQISAQVQGAKAA